MTKKVALVVAFLLVFAAAASAQQVVRVKGNRTPLRSEPTTSSNLLAYYEMGTKLLALELVNGWYRVRDPQTQRQGYVMATLVEVASGELAGPPPAAAQTPAPAQPAPMPLPPAPPPSKATTQPPPSLATPSTTSPRPTPAPGAQAKPTADGRPGAPVKPKLGIRGVADVSAVWMSASESFKAVTDTNMRVQFGGGVQVVNVWKGLYAEATVGRSSLDGSRVFVYEGTVYDLGIPVSITFTPIDTGVGWRFPLGKKQRLHVYAGGGVTLLQYQEESDFADAADSVDESFTGFYAAGGVEVPLTRWLHVRGEARYTSLPNALGAEGVSADFKETNLGGIAVAVKLAIGK